MGVKHDYKYNFAQTISAFAKLVKCVANCELAIIKANQAGAVEIDNLRKAQKEFLNSGNDYVTTLIKLNNKIK